MSPGSIAFFTVCIGGGAGLDMGFVAATDVDDD